MAQRILSISGLRGVLGDGLDPDFLVHFASALGTMANQSTVVLTRDGRATGELVRHAVISALMATGCKVIDGGIVSTPTCGVLVTHLGAAAGLQITASHNPIQWNGLKPFTADGSVFDHDKGAELLGLIESKAFNYVTWDKIGAVESLEDAAMPHLDRVHRLIDVDSVRQRRLKVVLDCNRGSGAVAGPRLLESLGCDIHVMGGTADGQFEHTPEPLKQNLTGLCDTVLARQADVGFAQDPDADRLAIVDNNGRYIGEELTLALCVDYVLARTPGPVVVNGSTSRATADIAARYDCPFHRSHVGEANVVAKMKEVSAIIGGEGNGGCIEPKVGYVRDSFAGMAYVLAGLAGADRSLAEWADAMPQYTIVKDKLECPRERVDRACAALKSTYNDATSEEGDGLRLDWSDRWVQVRASNTEPILRVIAEAPNSDAARTLCDEAMQIVKNSVA